MSPDQRGTYSWTEVEVDTLLDEPCAFEPIKDFGAARRLCANHLTWESPNREDYLDYDGSTCITADTYELRLISRVR